MPKYCASIRLESVELIKTKRLLNIFENMKSTFDLFYQNQMFMFRLIELFR